MKSLHFDVSVMGRGGSKRQTGTRAGKAQSAVAAAAYRSGQSLYSEADKERKDYTRKEAVIHSEIIAPEGAPEWVFDREQLWNRVEASETRTNSQLARDVLIALPRGLETTEQKAAFVQEFVTENFTRRGMIADASIHESRAGDGGRNPHAHIMLTMREIDASGPQGFAKKKQREWNDLGNVDTWRASAEKLANEHLARAGSAERVTYTGYAPHGIDKVPGEHLGPAAGNLEKRGIETTRGTKNRAATQKNAVREAVRGHTREADNPLLGSRRGQERNAEREAKAAREARREAPVRDAPVRQARGEAEFADAAVRLSEERRKQARAQDRALSGLRREARQAEGTNPPNEETTHREALARARAYASARGRQQERARVREEPKTPRRPNPARPPRPDSLRWQARKLTREYQRQALAERGLHGEVIPHNVATREALAANAARRQEEPARASHTASLRAALRGAGARAQAAAGEFINRVRGAFRREEDRGPGRTPARGSVWDAIKRESYVEREQERGIERERDRGYGR